MGTSLRHDYYFLYGCAPIKANRGSMADSRARERGGVEQRARSPARRDGKPPEEQQAMGDETSLYKIDREKVRKMAAMHAS